MIPHHCRVKHDPPNGLYGDCLRAVIASMFEVADPLEVPHFYHDGDDEAGQLRFKAYLLSRGYRPYYQAIKCPLPSLFTMMREINTNIEYLLFCKCGDGDHVVLCMNDQIIHDPAWVRTTITGPPSNTDDMWIIVTLVGGP